MLNNKSEGKSFNGKKRRLACIIPMDGGAWWAAVHGVAKSRTWLSDLTFTFHFHALEKEMATHSSTLAWKIPWTEEPGRLQSMALLRVRHGWTTALSLFTFMHWRRKWQPTPVFLPGVSQGRGAWWAAVSGVSQSRTRLKRLSSSSSLYKGRGAPRTSRSQLQAVRKAWK